MAYFPFFVDLEGKRCLIAGGGCVAYRKVLVLLEYQPHITVIAPHICRELEALDRRITLERREFQEKDMKQADLVIAATSDQLVNRQISRLCKELRIPVNVVDVREECSFIFPALIKEKDITVGISTGGKSPTVARYLKQTFSDAIPDCLEELVEELGSYRDMVKCQVPSLKARTAIFKELARIGILNGGRLTEDQVKEVIREISI